eukprot:gene4761-5387_t
MSGEGGRFSSPNYPKNYPINVTCHWTIRTVATSRILINFTDFRVEKNKKCLYDYLLIKESRNGWGTISSKYCGHGSISTYLSQENNVELRFVSDKLGNVDRGFMATWQLTNSRGEPVKKASLPQPVTTTVVKPCPTVTVTKAGVKCTEHGVLATKIINGIQPTKCTCEKLTEKTIYKTVEVLGGIKPTASVDGKAPGRTATGNSIPMDGTGCKNGAQADQKKSDSNNTNRNIVIAFGCLLFILIVANIILVAVICRKDSTGYSLYNMKTCLPRKNARPRTVEHFYSSGPRPTLRMVDGDIVVVSTNGTGAKSARTGGGGGGGAGDQSTLEVTNDSDEQPSAPIMRNDTRASQRQKAIERSSDPEIPFHIRTSPPHVHTLTMSSSGMNDDRSSLSYSDAELEYY